MDRHFFEKLDPDPHEKQNSRFVAVNGAVDDGKDVLKSRMLSLEDWKLLLEVGACKSFMARSHPQMRSSQIWMRSS
jgi:hypothetical protein